MLRYPPFIAIALSFAAACGDSGHTCAEVADHVAGLRADDDERAGRVTGDEITTARRARVLDQCEQQQLSQAVRSCLLAARDRAGVQACRTAETE
jgi:hypothetical protein